MPTIASPHILAVNQFAEVLELVADFLADAGYRVATQTASALDSVLVIQLPPDLIVLDAMWFADEWPLLQSLATDSRTQAILVVLCTIPVTANLSRHAWTGWPSGSWPNRTSSRICCRRSTLPWTMESLWPETRVP